MKCVITVHVAFMLRLTVEMRMLMSSFINNIQILIRCLQFSYSASFLYRQTKSFPLALSIKIPETEKKHCICVLAGNIIKVHVKLISQDKHYLKVISQKTI